MKTPTARVSEMVSPKDSWLRSTTTRWGGLLLWAVLSMGTFGTAFGQEQTATVVLPELPEGVSLDLFLLAGQSNMAGRGVVEAQDKVPNPRIWTWSKELQWVPAVDPLHFDKPKVAGVGPGRTFAMAVNEANPSAYIGLIPCAFGGTSINRWKKGEPLYDEAIARAQMAMKHGTLKAILWHQGETDLSKGISSDYWDKLRQVISDFRQDLGAPELPFIMGELGRFQREDGKGIPDFNRDLAAFARMVPHCACVSSEGLASGGDELHFSAAAARELGRRYATTYLELEKQATSSKSP